MFKQHSKMWQDDAHDYLVSNGQSKAICPLAREDAGDEDERPREEGGNLLYLVTLATHFRGTISKVVS